MTGDTPLLSVRGLTRTFVMAGGRKVHALSGVDLDVPEAGAVGVVGESGSGKTTFGRAVLRLIEPTSGKVTFRDTDWLSMGSRALRRQRRHMQMVFQDPFASINPRQRVGAMLEEPLIIHGQTDRAARRATVARMLESVGLAAGEAAKFPHQFSGGQRQRLAIARAAILDPALIIADEPVSALDVSIRSQVLNLLADLRRDRRMAMILIAHDLAVVGHVCDRIAVMYLGRIVEEGPSDALLTAPAHPYTRALVGSVYHLKGGTTPPKRVLQGDPPDPSSPPTGCPFHPRCPSAVDRCRTDRPELVERQTEAGPRRTACHLHPAVSSQAA